MFYTLIKGKAPSYSFQVILENDTPYTKKSVQKSQIPFFFFFKSKTIFSKILSFLQLDLNSIKCLMLAL